MIYGELVKKADGLARDLQPWPDYFDAKARELETVLRFCRFDRPDSALEIGCGNGFTSALLSGGFARVTAFDLPYKAAASHSPGIGSAKELIKRLGISNAAVAGGSAEELPFRDGSFDLVFSGYTLQYIKDRKKALGEMRRVLKDGGMAVLIVPNFMERIYTPLLKFEYVLRASLSRLAAANRPPADNAGRQETGGRVPKKTLEDHLLLRPDGAYKSFGEELLSHMPGSWKNLFEDSGLAVRKTFCTQLLPAGIFNILGAPSAGYISKRMRRLNDAAADTPLIKEFAYSRVLVAGKG